MEISAGADTAHEQKSVVLHSDDSGVKSHNYNADTAICKLTKKYFVMVFHTGIIPITEYNKLVEKYIVNFK